MEKSAVIDKHFEDAISMLSAWLREPSRRTMIRQVAKARHILGHYEYGDTNLFEWSDGKVVAAIIEELADAVVYQAWLEERAQEAQSSV